MCGVDVNDRNWARDNYLSHRALAQADNIRSQLERLMERHDLALVSTADQTRLYANVRRALVCGYFTQIARKDGKGSYRTVRDDQVRR